MAAYSRKMFLQSGQIKSMPRYTYKCDTCRETFETNHGMFFEKQDCDLCGAKDCLNKVPVFMSIKKVASTNKPGKIVDNYIRDAKQEIKETKRQFRGEEYDS